MTAWGHEATDEMASTTYCDFPRERVGSTEVRAAFEAGRTEDGYIFTQHTRINLYRTPCRL
jgi:hypothetical protein